MRHRKVSKRLKRPLGQRRAMLRNLAIALLKYQRIKTTRTKAQLGRSFFERLISLAKKDTLSAHRQAFKALDNRAAVSELFSRIAPLFKNRSSGFTRIIHLPAARRGDGAGMVLLELTEKLSKVKPASPKKEKPATKPEEPKHKLIVEEKAKASKEKPRPAKKVKPKKFLGGLRGLFKKGRDSL